MELGNLSLTAHQSHVIKGCPLGSSHKTQGTRQVQKLFCEAAVTWSEAEGEHQNDFCHTEGISVGSSLGKIRSLALRLKLLR